MGPSLGGDGKKKAAGLLVDPKTGFNGAVAWWRRKDICRYRIGLGAP